MTGSNDPASTLRHELRTLLNHVMGYAELVQEAIEGPDLEFLFLPLEDVRAEAGRALVAVDGLAPGRDAGSARRAVRNAMDNVSRTIGTLDEGVRRIGADNVAVDLLRVDFAARHIAALVDHPLMVSRLAAEEDEPTALPPTPMPSPDRPSTPSAPPHARPATGTVLVVDDDAANRDVLTRRLVRLGHDVVTACTGREALEVLEARPVDLVLLDLMMPEMNGLEVLEIRQEDPALRDIPFIMISARDETDRMAECIEIGAEDYLPKPFDPVLLEARVGASLEKKWLRDQEKALLATVQQQASELAQLNETLEERVSRQVEEIGRLAQLRRFLSPQLADLIVSSHGETTLQTHRREIAVLFCDLRGFTAFAETAEPEEVMSVLGEYHDTVGALIHEYQATVGFFAGDGLMVFFNDPVPCADPADKAVQLGVAMVERVGRLTTAWRTRGYGLGFAVGVAFGYATLGQMGFEGRLDYGVIGTVVNLAARLCDQAKPGQILVSGRTRLAVEDRWELEDVGELALKGFHSKVPAFHVVAPKGGGGG